MLVACGTYAEHDITMQSGGVSIVGYAEATPPVFTSWNDVADNIIGLAVDGLTPLPNRNDGVAIGYYGNGYRGGYATDNQVQHNTIAHNGRSGIMVWEHFSSSTNADRNRFSHNSIHDNARLGIDLGDDLVTPCDPGDPDAGPNQELNFPVITAAGYTAAGTTVSGTIDIDTAPTLAQVEIFKARLEAGARTATRKLLVR